MLGERGTAFSFNGCRVFDLQWEGLMLLAQQGECRKPNWTMDLQLRWWISCDALFSQLNRDNDNYKRGRGWREKGSLHTLLVEMWRDIATLGNRFQFCKNGMYTYHTIHRCTPGHLSHRDENLGFPQILNTVLPVTDTLMSISNHPNGQTALTCLSGNGRQSVLHPCEDLAEQ